MGSVGINVPITGDASRLTSALGAAKGSLADFASQAKDRLKAAIGDTPVSNRQMYRLSREIGQVYEETRTPQERYAARMERLNVLHRTGALDQATFARATSKAAEMIAAPSMASRVAGHMGAVGDTLGGMVGGPAGSLLSMAMNPATMTVAGGVGAMASGYYLSQQMADSAKNIRVQSQALNVTTTYYQNMGYAARKAGSDVETVTTAFERLRNKRDEAIGGNAAAEGAFRSMGISYNDLMSMSEEDLFSRVGRGVTGAHQAVTMFGRGGPALIPALKEIAKGEQSPFTQDPVETAAAEGLKVHVEGALSKGWGMGATSATTIAPSVWGFAKGAVTNGWAGAASGLWAAGSPLDRYDKMAKDADEAAAKRIIKNKDAALSEPADAMYNSLLTPAAQRRIAERNIENQKPFYTVGEWTKDETAHAARGLAIRTEAGSMASLDTPLQRFNRSMESIKETAEGRRFADDPAENAQRAAREVINAQLELRNAAQPGAMAPGVEATDAAGYSLVVGAQYGASETQALLERIAAAVEGFPQAVKDSVKTELGWQSRVMPYQGH